LNSDPSESRFGAKKYRYLPIGIISLPVLSIKPIGYPEPADAAFGSLETIAKPSEKSLATGNCCGITSLPVLSIYPNLLKPPTSPSPSLNELEESFDFSNDSAIESGRNSQTGISGLSGCENFLGTDV
jgi:hypothetical protein